MQANSFRRSVIAVAIAGAFAIGAVTADRLATIKPVSAAAPVATVTPATASASAAALPDFADLVAKHGPAVVQISVTHDAHKVAGNPFSGIPDELKPFFRNFPFQFNMPHPGPMRGRQQSRQRGFDLVAEVNINARAGVCLLFHGRRN